MESVIEEMHIYRNIRNCIFIMKCRVISGLLIYNQPREYKLALAFQFH